MQSRSKVTLTLAKSRWKLDGDPYVMTRLYKTLPFAKRSKSGKVSVPATDELARELMWVRQRYPFATQFEKELRTAAARHLKMESILSEGAALTESSHVAASFRPGKQLRDYQSRGAAHLRARRSLLLADELGLGKTVTALGGLNSKQSLPMLVLCPVSLMKQWAEKVKEFTFLESHVIKSVSTYDLNLVIECGACGETPTRPRPGQCRCEYCGKGQLRMRVPDVIICSYYRVHGWTTVFSKVCKAMVVDECQELRRSGSAKYSAVRNLAESMEYRLALSATPTHNLGGEIFNVLDVVEPGGLGSKSDFHSEWCAFSASSKEPPLADPEAFGSFLQTTGRVLRRTRAQAGRELPQVQRIVHPLESTLGGESAADAAALAQKFISADLGNSFAAGRSFEAMLYRETGLAKAAEVAEFVKLLLEGGDPVMLFGFHRGVYQIWLEKLAGYRPRLVTGSESAAQKAASVECFRRGETNLLICSLKSASGIDGLQNRCSVGVFGELDWSGAVITQGEGRYHRDGQGKACLTYLMLINDGSDPYMAETIGIKDKQLQGLLLDARKSTTLDQETAQEVLRRMAKRYLDLQAA